MRGFETLVLTACIFQLILIYESSPLKLGRLRPENGFRAKLLSNLLGELCFLLKEKISPNWFALCRRNGKYIRVPISDVTVYNGSRPAKSRSGGSYRRLSLKRRRRW